MQSTSNPLPSSPSPGDWYNRFINSCTADSLGDLESFETDLTTEVWVIFSDIPLAAWKTFATGPECPGSIRDLSSGFKKVKQSLSPVIRNHLLISPDFLLRLLMTVNCQDQRTLRQGFARLIDGINKALDQGANARSVDNRRGDSEELAIRVNYRMEVFRIRLRQLSTEKTQERWDRLDDTFWILSPRKVNQLAELLIEIYSAIFESSGHQELGHRLASPGNALKMARLSDRVHEAIAAAPQSQNTYKSLADVSNSIPYLDEI
jgi:hypothetical protein